MINKQELIKLIQSILKEIYPTGSYVRKGRIIKSYATDDKYYADIEILKNDDTPDENEPQVNSVEIPIIWAGANRGIICPPQINTLCDVEYYAGDPNYPRISNFRPGTTIPKAELDEFVLQQSLDTIFKIKADGSYEISGKNLKLTLTGNAEIKVDGNINAVVSGTADIKSAGKAIIKSDEKIEIEAPQVSFCGAVSATGALGVGSPCPLTGQHMKGSSKIYIDGGK